MLGIAERGYTFEHEMAFFPGLPLLIGVLGGWQGNEAIYMILGSIISCVSFVLATHLLYTLTLSLTSSKVWASRSAGKFLILTSSFICDSSSRDISLSPLHRITLCSIYISRFDISISSRVFIHERRINSRKRTITRRFSDI
jgi:hypothetical protein